MDVKQRLMELGYETLGDVREQLRLMPGSIDIDQQELFGILNTSDHPYAESAGDILQEMKKDDLLMHFMQSRESEKTGHWFEHYFEYCCVGVCDVIHQLSADAVKALNNKNILTDYDIRDQLLVSDSIYRVLSIDDREIVTERLNNPVIDLSKLTSEGFKAKSAKCFSTLVRHLYMYNIHHLRQTLDEETDTYMDWPEPEASVEKAAERLKVDALFVSAYRTKFVYNVLSRETVVFPDENYHPIVISDETYDVLDMVRQCLVKYPNTKSKVEEEISRYINLDVLRDESITTWKDLGDIICRDIIDIEINAHHMKRFSSKFAELEAFRKGEIDHLSW